MPLFDFDNSYARELPGTYAAWPPAAVPAPRLVFLNRGLARELRLDPDAIGGEAGAAIFAGNAVPEGAEPIAQAYAGHQFGGFSPQLGDGRALLLGEVVDRHGRRRDYRAEGPGTLLPRGGDGKAALGSDKAARSCSARRCTCWAS
ncbi:MAG: YdiU family protein [Rubrivivax sp.]|nr:YdiU family protein [Rubrivivax sp.]